MAQNANGPRPRPRFTIRGLLIFTLLVAMGFGWRASVRDAGQRLALQTIQLRYAEEELRRARDDLQDLHRSQQPERPAPLRALLDGARLSEATISCASNGFQLASLKNCDLQNATLEAGGASFQSAHFDGSKLQNATLQASGAALQRACFDGSNLAKARLSGNGSSLQTATFVGCDLTDAVLEGTDSSFQGCSFENATLVGTKLVSSVCAFQGLNISGARFEGADLSALDRGSLEGCYFKEPPTYNQQTRFPPGFDPVANSWRRVLN